MCSRTSKSYIPSYSIILIQTTHFYIKKQSYKGSHATYTMLANITKTAQKTTSTQKTRYRKVSLNLASAAKSQAACPREKRGEAGW